MEAPPITPERGTRRRRWGWIVAAAAVLRAVAHFPLLALGVATGRGHSWGRARRPTIGFQAYTIWHAVFFAPLVRELRAARDIDLLFVVGFQPLFPARDRTALRDFAIFTLGFPRSHVRSYWQCVWGQFDLVLYADVFAQFPWRRALNVLMYHGAGTPARFLKKMRLRKHVADFDVVLTNGPHDRDLLLAIRPGERQPEIHDVGCPLLDALFDPPVSRAEYLQALGLDIGRKTVLYAPHWSLLDGAAAAHAEHFVADAIGALASLDLNVVVKLHRFSYTRVGGGGIDWERSLAAFVGDNIAVDLHVDDVTALAHADVLVTDDQSSRALNASLIGKPVIVYRPRSEDPTELTVRDYWSHLAPIARVAQDLPDLRAHVRAAATESAALADERRQVASRFFSHPGEATREAVRVVTELLRRQSNG